MPAPAPLYYAPSHYGHPAPPPYPHLYPTAPIYGPGGYVPGYGPPAGGVGRIGGNKDAWSGVSKFKGDAANGFTNYPQWRLEVNCAMTLDDLGELSQAPPHPSDVVGCARYDAMNRYLFCKLVHYTEQGGIARSIVQQHEPNGVAALADLHEKYTGKNMANSMAKFSELLSLQLKPTEDPIRLCSRASQIARELTAQFSDLDSFMRFFVVASILSKLPPTYRETIAHVENLPTPDYSELTKRLNNQFLRERNGRKGQGGGTTDKAGGMVAQVITPNGKKTKATTQPTVKKCNHCKREGHEERECRKRLAELAKTRAANAAATAAAHPPPPATPTGIPAQPNS